MNTPAHSPKKNQLLQSQPRIKRGAITAQLTDGSVYVGTDARSVVLRKEGARAVIEILDGSRSLESIAQSFDVEHETLIDLIAELEAQGLLDMSQGSIVLPGRFKEEDQCNDAAQLQLRKRIAPELSLTTWIDGVRDGGVELLSRRQMCEVEIFGHNRISTLLFGLLLASGITQTHISGTSRSGRAKVDEIDCGTGFLRSSDYGADYYAQLRQQGREISLFPIPLDDLGEEVPQKFLRVFIGKGNESLISQSMSEAVEHLIVTIGQGPHLQIGPLVLPGKTPCLRCVNLARAAADSYSSSIDLYRENTAEQEIPIAIAHQVAGLIAQEILHFFDTESSTLMGAHLKYNYLRPSELERIRFARHPLCGCSWN